MIDMFICPRCEERKSMDGASIEWFGTNGLGRKLEGDRIVCEQCSIAVHRDAKLQAEFMDRGCGDDE